MSQENPTHIKRIRHDRDTRLNMLEMDKLEKPNPRYEKYDTKKKTGLIYPKNMN